MTRDEIYNKVIEILKKHSRTDSKLGFGVTIEDIATWISEGFSESTETSEPINDTVDLDIMQLSKLLNKKLDLIKTLIDNQHILVADTFEDVKDISDSLSIIKDTIINNVVHMKEDDKTPIWDGSVRNTNVPEYKYDLVDCIQTNKGSINIPSVLASEPADPKQLNLLDQIKEVENNPLLIPKGITSFNKDGSVTFEGDITAKSKPILKIKLTTPKPTPTAELDHRLGINEVDKLIANWKDFTPTYGSTLAAAMDCRADLSREDAFVDNGTINVEIFAGHRRTIPLGFHCATPKGYKLTIKPRSGLAAKKGLTIVNSPGTVDEDYRGVVMAILLNTGTETITINHGDRICQAELERYEQCTCKIVDELDETERGEGGFGHTGIK